MQREKEEKNTVDDVINNFLNKKEGKVQSSAMIWEKKVAKRLADEEAYRK